MEVVGDALHFVGGLDAFGSCYQSATTKGLSRFEAIILRMAEFGSCCDDLHKALTPDFEPLLRVDADNGGEALNLIVGWNTAPDGTISKYFGNALEYCPFCGVQLKGAQALPRPIKMSASIDAERTQSFGTCCAVLEWALTTPQHSTFYASDDGIFYFTLGYITTDNGTGYFDQAALFCPFCGTQLQTRERIQQISSLAD